MTTKVVMEALSPTMEEGRLVEWKKQEGETVAVGDVLAEVETDKAVMELVARAAGTLLKHVIEAGATVPVSDLVAVIGEPGEDVSGAAGQAGSGAAERPAPKETQATQPTPGENRPVSMPPAPPAAAAVTAAPRPSEKPPAREGNGAQGAPARVKASPLARRMASERGMDLSAVVGSGPEGRIVARDLEGAAATASSPTAPPPRGPAAPLEIDLRGMTGDEAEMATLAAVDAAVLSEQPFLRIIHGMGTGVVRERVQRVVSKDRRVSGYAFAPRNQGGTGVTIVEFSG